MFITTEWSTDSGNNSNNLLQLHGRPNVMECTTSGLYCFITFDSFAFNYIYIIQDCCTPSLVYFIVIEYQVTLPHLLMFKEITSSGCCDIIIVMVIAVVMVTKLYHFLF